MSRVRVRRTCILILWAALSWPGPTALSPCIAFGSRAETGSFCGPEEQAPEPLPLHPGETTEASLGAGEAYSYLLRIDAGQYVRLVVEPRGIELQAVVDGPSGDRLRAVPCRETGSTALSVIARVAGTYRLELRAMDGDPGRGRYEIRVTERRPTLVGDENRLAAEDAFTEAEILRAEGRAEASRRALQKLEKALRLWKAVGDQREQASALRALGEVHHTLGEADVALRYFGQALELSQQIQDRSAQTAVLSRIGYLYRQLDDNPRALEHCTEGLRLSQAAGDRRREAEALNFLGAVYYQMRDLDRALGFYHDALGISRDLGDRREQARALLQSAFIYSDLSAESKALEAFELALGLWRSVRDRRGEAITLIGLGHLHSKLGEKQKALNLYREARAFFESMSDAYWEAGLASGMAFVYLELGEAEMALEYYREALRLNQLVRSRSGEAQALRKIGRILASQGDREQALAHFERGLAVFRSLGDRRMESVALGDIGSIYEARGERDRALDCYQRALSLNRASGHKRAEAYTLNSIGSVYRSLGDRQKAVEHYELALSLARAAGDLFGESLTLYHMARLERDAGHLGRAREQMEAALKIAESLRSKVASEDLRASYFASIHQYHDFYVDLLMRMHRERIAEGLDAAALQASERTRARSLLESLAEAGLDVRGGVEPSLLEREENLERQLDAKSEQHAMLLSRAADEDEVADLARELRLLTTEHDELRAEIRSKSPRYGALSDPRPMSLEGIQSAVLDDDTLLLEYFLGEERSFLWAVTKTALTSHELPPLAEIEKAVRELYALLTARQPVPGETARQHRVRVREADARYWREASALARVLLGPVTSELGRNRLLIVADGALQYLPFVALPVPESSDPNPVPLGANHEIVSLPSASTLAVLRREIAERKPAPRTAAVLADPVFERDDPRLGRTAAREAVATRVTSSDLQRALRDAGLSHGGAGVPRLLATRREAEAILAFVAPGAGFKAIDFDASRAVAESPELGRYRIVHFATHGLLNNERPELSGLILSLVDREGRPQSGFLRLHDIYNLSLPVELVVLSACSTALGKEVRGEGLIGLVRGFMYAGAARVVASLWKVDDEATGELMRRFYRHMLVEGLSPAAALRAAQVDLWKQKQWGSPFYWAAFVLQGEYR